MCVSSLTSVLSGRKAVLLEGHNAALPWIGKTNLQSMGRDPSFHCPVLSWAAHNLEVFPISLFLPRIINA